MVDRLEASRPTLSWRSLVFWNVATVSRPSRTAYTNPKVPAIWMISSLEGSFRCSKRRINGWTSRMPSQVIPTKKAQKTSASSPADNRLSQPLIQSNIAYPRLYISLSAEPWLPTCERVAVHKTRASSCRRGGQKVIKFPNLSVWLKNGAPEVDAAYVTLGKLIPATAGIRGPEPLQAPPPW